MARILVAILLAAFASAGCFLMVDLGDYHDAAPDASSPRGGGGGGGAAGAGGVGGGTFACPPSKFGPGLVLVENPTGQAYCIDSTEVTGSQYAIFIGQLTAQPTFTDVCSWKTSLDTGEPFDESAVVMVDWCDAREFCRSAGKRLCGKVGGGAVDFTSGWSDALQSEWQNACSQGGNTIYPYGPMYDPTRCNGSDTGSTGVATAAEFPDCHGTIAPFDALLNLSGNAYEWEDSCNGQTGPLDLCHRRGGSFQSASDQLLCAHDDVAFTRGDHGYTTGIRCCADALAQ